MIDNFFIGPTVVFTETSSGTMSCIKNHSSARMRYSAFNLMSCFQAHHIIIKSDKESTECPLVGGGVLARNTFKYL